MCLMWANTSPVLGPQIAVPYTYNILQYKNYKQSQQKIIQKGAKITCGFGIKMTKKAVLALLQKFLQQSKNI